MSRPREFNDDAVIARVTEVFTAHGYKGTSMAMLMEASGLAKQSLYNAFGDKRSLYLLAVNFMRKRMCGACAAMAASPRALDGIRLMVAALVDASADPDPSVHTCLMSAGLLEGIDDESVAATLRGLWSTNFDAMLKAVERGQVDGSVRSDTPARELANLVMTLTGGLRISARVVKDTDQLRAIAALGLRMLEPPVAA